MGATAVTLTMDDAEADSLGLCRHCNVLCDGDLTEPHRPECPMATGLGTARGDQAIPGERCAGPCRQSLEAGEHYVYRDDGMWCVGCASTTEGA